MDKFLSAVSRKKTDRNRNLLKMYYYEFQNDKDYYPWSDDNFLKFISDRSIKNLLD